MKLLNSIQNKCSAYVRINNEATSHILRILWISSMNNFWNEIELLTYSHRTTKRIILLEIAKLFDPLDLIGPIIVVSKILLQEIWQVKLHWAEFILLDLHTRWSALKDQLNELNKLNIPRFVGAHIKYLHFQIHDFVTWADDRMAHICLYNHRQIANDEFRIDAKTSRFSKNYFNSASWALCCSITGTVMGWGAIVYWDDCGTAFFLLRFLYNAAMDLFVL